ncbi:MAG: hypothetical protein GEU99_25075 [Luteitalea sp.]|nr:hypothetical protein [Luteitalea sp.]
MTPFLTRLLISLVALAGFVVLATANAVGYRYGLDDQLGYLPALLRALDPTLFPRDDVLIDAQGSLMLFDQLLAVAVRLTGVSLPMLMLCGYILSLSLMLGAGVAFARPFLASGWSVAAFCTILTLRHRIAETSTNTLEGYFHPRVLAFALGIAALVVAVNGLRAKRGRPPSSETDAAENEDCPRFPSRLLASSLVALMLVLAAGLIHPLTGLWFAIWLWVALWVNEPRLRGPLAVVGLTCAVGAVWALAVGPLAHRLTRVDPAWAGVIAVKDYLFPARWPAEIWILHFGGVFLILLTWLVRRRRGLAHAHEAGVVAGCLALVAMFLLSLPFIEARIALAVQLQTSRVFWTVDFLATLYVVWWLTEGARRGRPRLVFAAVLLFSVARGFYIMNMERPGGRTFAQVDVAPGPWRDAGLWLRAHTARDAYLLADPDHAWKYGANLRLTAQRDVFVERMKDTAFAIFARDVASRVGERLAATRYFTSLNETALLRLARRYDLDYLLTDRKLALPAVYRNRRFHIYDLHRARGQAIRRGH